MKSILISIITVLLGSALVSGSSSAPGSVMLVAHGSNVTINLPAEYTNNKLLSVISDTGNNNPALLDWIGSNGANMVSELTVGENGAYKEPQHSMLGDNLGNHNVTSDIVTALYNALLKRERSTVEDDRDIVKIVQYDDGGENKVKLVASSTQGMHSMKAPSKIFYYPSGGTKTTFNTRFGKYLTDTMSQT